MDISVRPVYFGSISKAFLGGTLPKLCSLRETNEGLSEKDAVLNIINPPLPIWPSELMLVFVSLPSLFTFPPPLYRLLSGLVLVGGVGALADPW